jgi:hypothetical protein
VGGIDPAQLADHLIDVAVARVGKPGDDDPGDEDDGSDRCCHPEPSNILVIVHSIHKMAL